MTRAAPVPILWLYGADAVGKSTVAWEIYEQLTARGVAMAYVDADYLGFCRPGFADGASRLVELNLGCVWSNFAAAGARSMIVAGVVVTHEELQRYQQSIPGASITLGRLHAADHEIAARITYRRRLESARAAGFSALEQTELSEYAERSAKFSRHLADQDFSDFTVDTTGRTVTEVAESESWRRPRRGLTPQCEGRQGRANR